MRYFLIAICLASLCGCGVDASKINAGKMKQTQQKQASRGSAAVQEQTGVDLGTATPAPKKGLRLTTSQP